MGHVNTDAVIAAALRCVERRTVPCAETMLATSARPLLTQSVAVITLLAPGNATARRAVLSANTHGAMSASTTRAARGAPRGRAMGAAIPRGRAVQRRPLRGTGGPARGAPGAPSSAASCRRGDVAIVATAVGIDARNPLWRSAGRRLRRVRRFVAVFYSTEREGFTDGNAAGEKFPAPNRRNRRDRRFAIRVNAFRASYPRRLRRLPGPTTQGAASTPSVVGPRLTHPGRARCQSSQGSRFEYAPRCHFAT